MGAAVRSKEKALHSAVLSRLRFNTRHLMIKSSTQLLCLWNQWLPASQPRPGRLRKLAYQTETLR